MNESEARQFSVLVLRSFPAAGAEALLAAACRIDASCAEGLASEIGSSQTVKLFSAEHFSGRDYCTAAEPDAHPKKREVDNTEYFVYDIYAAEVRVQSATWIVLGGAYSGLLRDIIRKIEGDFAKKKPLKYLKVELAKFLESAANPEKFAGELKILQGEFRLDGETLASSLSISGKNFVASNSYKSIKPAVEAGGVSMIPTRLTCGCNLNANVSRAEELRPFDLKMSLDEHGNFKLKTNVDIASIRTMRAMLNVLAQWGAIHDTEICPARRRNGAKKQA